MADSDSFSDSSTTSDLTPRQLRLEVPDQYRIWLRVGIVAIIVGYTLALLSILVEQDVDAGSLREPYVILAGCVALVLERAGKLRLAAFLALGALWIEIHASLLALGLRAAVDTVFPAMVVGVALFCGTRVSMGMAFSTLLTVPGAILLGKWLGWGPGFVGGDSLYLVALEVSTITTSVLTTFFTRAFSRALLSSDRSARRAREVIDGAPDAIVVLSREGLIEDCNPVAERVLGLERGRAAGTSFDDLGLLEVAAASHRNGEPVRANQPRQYEVRGGALILEGLTSSITRADGSQGSLVILRDVTERQQAEVRERDLQEQLQHSQKFEAIGQLAGGVAHEFNNLLTAVGGYGELLALHPDARVRDIALELAGARDRGAGLTRQLLAFARKEVVQPRGMDLAVALAGLEPLLKRLLGEQVTLSLAAPEPCIIYADAGQISQVLLNLILNARDAMPDGGTLSIACRHLTNSQHVELSVRDTGHGMRESTRCRAFEPFFTTKPSGQGTGLGLSTVHGIVVSSGGSIAVDSEPDRGTCFTLRWPAHDTLDERPSSRPPLSSGSVPSARVLLAEDDQHGRKLLPELLRAVGYEVVMAPNGEQALDQYRSLVDAGTPPDILLSDVRMPGMTGVELAKRLRQEVPSLPVLLISGYPEQTLESSSFDPVSDLLLKPFSTEALVQRIERKLAPMRKKFREHSAARP